MNSPKFLAKRMLAVPESPTARAFGRAAELRRQGRSILPLGVGELDFPTPPHICEAAIRAIHDGKTVWLYRDRLADANVIDGLFADFDGYLKGQGYLARGARLLMLPLCLSLGSITAEMKTRRLKLVRHQTMGWPDPLKAARKIRRTKNMARAIMVTKTTSTHAVINWCCVIT